VQCSVSILLVVALLSAVALLAEHVLLMKEGRLVFVDLAEVKQRMMAVEVLLVMGHKEQLIEEAHTNRFEEAVQILTAEASHSSLGAAQLGEQR